MRPTGTRFLVPAAVVATVLFAVWFLFRGREPEMAHVKFIGAGGAGAEFFLEVADTPEERARGLAGRRALDEREGTLFLFGPPRAEATRPAFWMKGMEIPIDIIWIRDSVIRALTERAAPPPAGMADADLLRFIPPEPVDAVIEIRGGRAAEIGLAVGQRVEILLP